jgi:hypothetical protein
MGIRPLAVRTVARLAPLTIALGFACGSPKPAEKPAAPTPAGGVHRYLPLKDKTVFSYETSTEGGERGLLVLEVRRPRPDLAELVVAGRARRLTVNAHDIAHVTGGFFLREPLTVGATWKGDFGQVTVKNANRQLTVPAGAFTGCIETLEEAVTTEGEKRTTTVFCPDIGIALRETEAEQDGQFATERIALKSYGAVVRF